MVAARQINALVKKHFPCAFHPVKNPHFYCHNNGGRESHDLRCPAIWRYRAVEMFVEFEKKHMRKEKRK